MKILQENEVSDEMIRMQRAKLHISQQELAIRTGVSREKITALENAKCKIVSEAILSKLADIFDVRVEDLLKKEER